MSRDWTLRPYYEAHLGTYVWLRITRCASGASVIPDSGVSTYGVTYTHTDISTWPCEGWYDITWTPIIRASHWLLGRSSRFP